MKVTTVPISEVTPDPANVRLHDDRNLDAIRGSLARFGQQKPIVVDSKGVIRAGNGTYLAAKALGWESIEVVRTDLAGLEAAAFAIADNRTSDLSTFDGASLAKLLQELHAEDAFEGLGFEDGELDQLLDELQAGASADIVEDEPPAPPLVAASRPGDLWLLGNHRLLCGDSASPEAVDRLLAGAPIHLVSMDPPYNVKVEPRSNNAIAAGLSSFAPQKQTHHQKFDLKRHPSKSKPTTDRMRPKDRPLANDFISEADFAEALLAWFGNAARALLPGRGFYIWGGYANLANYPGALAASGLYFSQAIVWNKLHPVLTRKDFMGAFELAFYGWKEGAAHQFLGPNNATDLWEIKKLNHTNMVHLCLHPDADVLTESGFRPIRTLKAGDRVFSGDGQFHRVSHVTSHEYTSERLYRITAKGGNASTLASDNHPFLIWRRDGEVAWVRADEVRVGDCTMTPLPSGGRAHEPLRIDAGDGTRLEEALAVHAVVQVVEHEGRSYSLRAVESVEAVPYEGEVWNLSVEGHPSFQTAVGLSHNTEKPVELAARAIQYSSRKDENVLDLFGGSGSTMAACEQTGRRAYLMELDQPYADVIVDRWQRLTKQQAKLDGDGRTFDEVRAERVGNGEAAQ